LAPIIKTEKLNHLYSAGTPFERLAIKDIDFEAEKGEFIGIIGHTGSGKSTFIQHLNGLLKPTSGRVLFNGTDIWEKQASVRNVRLRSVVFSIRYISFLRNRLQGYRLRPKI
jgi:energy-coupling factor transport system ATP-binding protein